MDGDGEYDYDIYDEDIYADEDPYYVDEYNWDPYSTGSRQQRRLDAARQQRRVDAAQGIIKIHNDAYMVKEPCRTSALTGAEWLAELNVGHPKHIYQSFRMSKTNFFALCELLESRYGLEEGEQISVQEQVAIFLWVVGQRANNRNTARHIERTFGVWKARWPLVCDIPVGYTMETQRDLVTTTMAIHNFIRRSNMPDNPFGFYDRRPNFLPSDASVETTAPNGQHEHVFVGDDQDMENVRASIRDWIVANRIR
ncbi:hypothetical protein RHGRI_026632 [Rhododendron griersonianum]|uniref:DUF8040 domain-containing protein n=1 Tax=Rhododendron griersonianum TaxID=479676 RepID=A0AAV6IX66_9ERIC|nr:hypothetical protein RHGRI_026632 [Rhododendron griersonianum]